MRVSIAVLAFAGLCTTALPAYSQTYPSRPIRFVLPYSPGGSYDALARVLAQALT